MARNWACHDIDSTTIQAPCCFFQLNVRNLSREEFGVIVVFGIDYQHQEISLSQVPERFMIGLKAAFEQADYGNDLKDLLVEFKEAGTNSLDYLIYATMGVVSQPHTSQLHA